MKSRTSRSSSGASESSILEPLLHHDHSNMKSAHAAVSGRNLRETPMEVRDASRLDEGLSRTVGEDGIIRYSSGRDKKVKLSNRMSRITKKVSGAPPSIPLS